MRLGDGDGDGGNWRSMAKKNYDGLVLRPVPEAHSQIVGSRDSEQKQPESKITLQSPDTTTPGTQTIP